MDFCSLILLVVIHFIWLNSPVLCCQYFCCEGDRKAFVTLGWKDCCPEAKCNRYRHHPSPSLRRELLRDAEVRKTKYKLECMKILRLICKNSVLVCFVISGAPYTV